MAAPAQTQTPIDHNDINDWTGRLNEHLSDVGGTIKSKSPVEARSWTSSLFGCFAPIDVCLITCCLPCVTFGKTHHRTRKDATMAGYSAVNTSCLLFCGAGCFGLNWIPMAMQRADIRRKYNLKGDCITDLFLSCCCGCCSLIQQEKESDLRERELLAPAAGEYKSEGGMQYAPQQAV